MDKPRLIYCNYFGTFYQDDKGYYYIQDGYDDRIDKTKEQVIKGLDKAQRELYKRGRLRI